MKKYVALLMLVLTLVPGESLAQGWLNKVVNGYRQRAAQQQTNQRTNNQRTYQSGQRNGSQERTYQQRRETQQRNTYQQQNNIEESAVSSKSVSPSNTINNQTQNNDKVVTLVTSGTGATKEEATRNALRSALEQVFGTFVSANTHIVNDDLIKDEIVSVTSGNIENYSIISYDNSSGGIMTAVVKATISIGKLVQYAQSKGATVELAGATFAMNMKIRKMETENEYQALLMLKNQMCIIAKKGIYDYNVTIGEPSLKTYPYPTYLSEEQQRQYKNSYKIPIKVDYYPNKNAEELVDCILRTLKGISIPISEVESYKNAGLPVYQVSSNIYLRNNPFSSNSKRLMPFELLKIIKTLAACSFNLTDNLGNNISPVMDNVQQGSYTIARAYNHTLSVRDKHIPEINYRLALGYFRNNYNTDSAQFWCSPLDLSKASFHINFLFHYSEVEMSNLTKVNVTYNDLLMDSFIDKLKNYGYRLSD